MIGLPIIWRLRTLAFAALALVVFGATECPPTKPYLNFTRLFAVHPHNVTVGQTGVEHKRWKIHLLELIVRVQLFLKDVFRASWRKSPEWRAEFRSVVRTGSVRVICATIECVWKGWLSKGIGEWFFCFCDWKRFSPLSAVSLDSKWTSALFMWDLRLCCFLTSGSDRIQQVLQRTATREFSTGFKTLPLILYPLGPLYKVGVISAKNHKRQRRKRQSVTAKREKSQTPKVLTAILILPNLTSLNLT